MAWFGQNPTSLGAHEDVLLYSSYASLSADGTHWQLAVQGCVVDSRITWLRRQPVMHFIQRAMRIDNAGVTYYRPRMRAFLRSGVPGRSIRVACCNVEQDLVASGKAGLFRDCLSVPVDQADAGAIEGSAQTRWLPVHTVLPPADGRQFSGQVQLVNAVGLSIISDVDDTLKHSNVPNRRDLFHNTFSRKFRPVPGMPELYGECARLGAAFHYVSGSPWQLYEPLTEFWRTTGVPMGSFHLKPFRFRDTARKLRGMSPQKSHKLSAIEPILAAFPQRQFVLVGDSGEQDPEIYSTLLHANPEQIAGVCIRAVRGAEENEARFAALFGAFPPERWLLYRESGQLVERMNRYLAEHLVDSAGPTLPADSTLPGTSIVPADYTLPPDEPHT